MYTTVMKKKQIKKDLSAQPVTQGDLDTWGGELTSRLDRMEKTMATKDELRQMEKRIIFEFKAAVENIHDEMAGANKDEISAMKDKDTDLDQRVTVLEKHVLHH